MGWGGVGEGERGLGVAGLRMKNGDMAVSGRRKTCAGIWTCTPRFEFRLCTPFVRRQLN